MSICILAIFKNESEILDEWINHYKNEGIDHFILIDNNSTDNYQEILSQYIISGLVTLIKDDRIHIQKIIYNDNIDKCKKYDWVIVCDLDEFIYSRNEYKTIKQFLINLSNDIGQICISWKMFGSNGFNTLEKLQPKSVIKSFTKRRSIFNNETKKSIVRTKYLKSFNIHRHILNNGINYYCDKNNSSLHCNHYAIQSLDWFMRIKNTRGDAVNGESVWRDKEYFKKYDSYSNEVDDIELANKIYI